ncbi:MAG: hypothetical protein ACI8P0_004342 [Planctomycetaceae bacterium]|jgi:hypothetical protein
MTQLVGNTEGLHAPLTSTLKGLHNPEYSEYGCRTLSAYVNSIFSFLGWLR